MPLFKSSFNSPIGKIGLLADEANLISLSFTDPNFNELKAKKNTDRFEDIILQLNQYFYEGRKSFNLNYELLVENQESESRQLIDYLGLDWDEKCLSPQNNDRSVGTASNLQIRKKVYRGSSEQWRKYEPFLGGALDGLLEK